MQLGKLKEIRLRDIWEHEQYDFSAWLAKEENLNLLSEELGLSLIEPETEKYVGTYRCDILCKDEITNKIVLIENQLETTNHDHLGKIITYASGMNASYIIWIVESAKEEHISAIEWLNNHTDDEVSFFLIEIHAYQIGDSIPAPMFKVIEQPNDFAVNIKKASLKSEMSDNQSSRLDFWTRFNETMKIRKEFNVRKASTDHWYNFAIGTSACHINADLLAREHRIRVGIWIPPYNPNAKELFDSLILHKNEIENDLGFKLDWQRLDGKKACRICTYINGLNFDDDSNYEWLFNKLIDTASKLRTAFKKHL